MDGWICVLVHEYGSLLQGSWLGMGQACVGVLEDPLGRLLLAVRPTSGLDHSPAPTNTHQTLLKHSSVSICADDCLLGQRPLSGTSEVQQINK